MAEVNITTCKLANLDNLVAEFYHWKNMYEKLLIEKYQLQKDSDYNKTQLHLAKNKENSLQEEKMQLRASIVNLQGTIQNLLYLETQNASLTQQIKETEENFAKFKMEYGNRIELLNKKLQDSVKQHEIAISDVKLHSKMEAEAQIKAYKKIITEKESEVLKQQEQIDTLQKSHMEEMMKVQIEYDHRLMKLQEQHVKSLRAIPKSNTTAGVDILRKKMQNMQEQHTSEVSALQQKVKALEDQLRQRYEHNSSSKENETQNNRLTLKKRKSTC